MAAKPKPTKITAFPTTLGECIDLAYKAREARLKYEREAEEETQKLKAREKAIEEHIINTFKKGDIEGAKGRLANAGINRIVVADVKDWGKLYAYVAKTKSWDLLRRQLNDKAYRERLEAKKSVPGVVPFTKVKLSLTKR